MRTGLVLMLLGAWLFCRTVFEDDHKKTIVDRILAGVKPPPKAIPVTYTSVGSADPATTDALHGALVSATADWALAGPLARRPKQPAAGVNHPAP